MFYFIKWFSDQLIILGLLFTTFFLICFNLTMQFKFSHDQRAMKQNTTLKEIQILCLNHFTCHNLFVMYLFGKFIGMGFLLEHALWPSNCFVPKSKVQKRPFCDGCEIFSGDSYGCRVCPDCTNEY